MKKRKLLSFISFVLAAVMLLTTAGAGGITTYASETATVAADTSTTTGIVQGKSGYFYLYKEGVQVKKSGWNKVDTKTYAWLNEKYKVIFKYVKANDKVTLYKYDAEKKALVENVKNSIVTMPDGKLLYFGKKGKAVTTQGWYKLPSGTLIYVGGNGGRVDAKLTYTKLGSTRYATRFFKYDYSKKEWVVQKNVWKNINGTLYFFNAKTGAAYKSYNAASGKYYEYSDTDLELVKNDISTINSKYIYYFNAKGVKVTDSGWYETTDGTKVHVGSNKGIVDAKLTTTKNKAGKYLLRYYKYDYSAENWVLQKDVWKEIEGTLYYFNANTGNAYRSLDTETDLYSKYSGTELEPVKNNISTVKGKAIYYFNAKGVREKTSGWYTISDGTKVYVGKGGYVTAKFTKKDDVRRYYTYDYENLKWVAKKNTWVSVQEGEYYLGSSGVAKLIYNTNTKRLTCYSGGKLEAVKKQYKKLKDGKIYYFGTYATKVTKAGWYAMNSTDKVYVGDKGYVTKLFSTKSRKLLKYNYSEGKWERIKVTSCVIDKKTYYFNSDGIMAKSEIVGNSKKGYFYVDETGLKVTSKEIQLAVDFVIARTDDTMTREEKLKACFVYLSRNYPYLRDYTTPTDASKFSALCIDMLTNNHGNCYRCAATFACVATVLGYDARVTCGKVTNLQGTGLTIHGWTEIYREEDKAWVVYDVSMQRNWPARNYYHIYMKDYYPNHRVVGPRARLTVKNGKVNWRWLKDSELSGR